MPHPLAARGRGARFTRLRALSELALEQLYRGDWPARLWSRVPGATDVRRVETTLSLGLAAPLTIAFASDLHLGPTTSARTLDRAFAHLVDARPDLLALGGDYVYLQATPAKARELAARVAAVPARVKLAVLGNHDLWAEHPRLEAALAEVGVRVLVNDGLRLPPPHDDIGVIGLDDPWTGSPDVARATKAIAGARRTLAIGHAPEVTPLLEGYGVSLLLCGHTHGGQIALPGSRPVYVPGHLGKRYPFGRHRVGDLELIVSRGVGATELPIRAFAPPDVQIVRIT